MNVVNEAFGLKASSDVIGMCFCQLFMLKIANRPFRFDKGHYYSLFIFVEVVSGHT